jgi:phospholipase/carboxylesterase
LDAAADAYGYAPEKLIGLGYSNGANMAWTTMLLRPSSLSQLVLFRPMVTLADEADLRGKHIFVSAGRYDALVPEANTQELVEQMRGCGAEVELHLHDGGHELHHDEIDRARSWLR